MNQAAVRARRLEPAGVVSTERRLLSAMLKGSTRPARGRVRAKISSCRSCSFVPTRATPERDRWLARFGKVRTSICWAACCRKTRQTSRFSLEKRRSLTRRTRFTRTFGIFGKSAAREVVVEFYWLDPSLGISGGGTHLIGQAFTALGSRYSGHSHVVVKCPEAWEAKYANGGHECLIVRAWDVCSDALSTPEWDASLNRHIAQRNIHVIAASELDTAPPLLLKVGPLFGAPATIQVERAQPSAMPWLQLRSGGRGQFPAPAAPTGVPLLSPPSPVGGSPQLGLGDQHQHVAGDDQQVGFTTTDAPPSGGQAHVYRVTASQGGQAVGGYTVVVSG